MPAATHKVVREGLMAGIIGAVAVAVWFLVLDLIAGRPFFTPYVLGDALLSVFDPRHPSDGMFVTVAAYTVFHFAAFMLVGLLVSVIVNRADQTPSVLAGLLVLFVAIELAFQGLVALLEQATALRGLAWYQVMVGNLIAALVMGGYLWWMHPALREEFAHALDGTGE